MTKNLKLKTKNVVLPKPLVFSFQFSVFSCVMLLVLSLPSLAFAAELRLETSQVEVKAGDQFVVEVLISTNEPINALEGELVFPPEVLAVANLDDGGSYINLWIQGPVVEAPGTLVFAGVTPGGFQGVNVPVFSIIFTAIQDGPALIEILQATALLNDGQASEASLSFRNVLVSIKPGDSNLRTQALNDTAPPEYFTPVVSHDPDLFNDDWFVAFATQDKGSGLAGYQIKESRYRLLGPLTKWQAVTSPYPLKDQELKSYLIIQAVDNAGNVRLSQLAPTNSLSWRENLSLWSIIMAAACFGLLFIVWALWRQKRA